MQIPLSFKDSFDLLCKSAEDIKSWQIHQADPEYGHIVWKQRFWSLTGTAGISAQLEKVEEKETSVLVEIHKPLQILDPLKFCDMVFRKLDQALKKNIEAISK